MQQNKKPVSAFDMVHLSTTQIGGLKKEIKELEQMWKEDRQRARPKITDEAEFQKVIKDKKKLLVDHAPQPFQSEAQKNKAYAASKKLAEFISNQMPPKRAFFQMHPKETDKWGNPVMPDHTEKQEFDRTVRQQMRFQTNPKIQRAVHLYKNIMRRLDPMNPSIANIERLRK